MANRERAPDGKFLPGNKFWKIRTNPGGRPAIFQKPEDLETACASYFDWVHENPLYEDSVVKFQGMATHEPIAKMRAMTITGMCLHLGIGEQTWHDYNNKPDFSEVTTWAEMVIRTQKFEGAAANLLSVNIIARDLGLREKSEADLNIKGDISEQIYAARGRARAAREKEDS